MDRDRHYLKVDDVAGRLNMTASAVYKLCKDGTIPSIRIGTKTVRIPAAALEAYLRSLEGPRTYAVDEAAEAGGGNLDEALMHRLESFHERTGMSPDEYITRWREGAIEDTPDTSRLAIEALGLRGVGDRAPAFA